MRSTVALAKLESGEIVKYDYSRHYEWDTPKGFVFLGSGVIYSINGVEQDGTQKLYFFKIKENNNE